MKIENSSVADLEEILGLYKEATKLQKIKFPGNQWPEFSRELIIKELGENRQFKIIIDKQIACVWAVTFSDPEIWEEKNFDPSIYIHRIATNPKTSEAIIMLPKLSAGQKIMPCNTVKNI